MKEMRTALGMFSCELISVKKVKQHYHMFLEANKKPPKEILMYFKIKGINPISDFILV
jgi:hypothetical protein